MRADDFCKSKVERKSARCARNERVWRVRCWLGSGQIYVDGEGDVVAEFGPGGVGAEFDAFDLGGRVGGFGGGGEESGGLEVEG
jgi:hypothetical protein